MKKILSILMLTVMVMGLVGCSSPEEATNKQISIVDMGGKEITLESTPQRIVSLSPTNTEIIFAIGGEDKLVGVTTYCDFPEAAQSIEKIGGFSDTNVELIVSLQPDLVIGGAYVDENVKTTLESLGIPVANTEATSIDAIYESIELVGALIGHEDGATKVVEDMKSEFAQIATEAAGKEPLPIFYVVWNEPLQTAGKNTFIDEVIGLAGGKNIAGELESWAMYSVEELIKQNPYGVISAKHSRPEEVTIQTFQNDMGFKDLSAIKEGRLYIMSDDNTISRGGPRIVDAAREMMNAIDAWR